MTNFDQLERLIETRRQRIEKLIVIASRRRFEHSINRIRWLNSLLTDIKFALERLQDQKMKYKEHVLIESMVVDVGTKDFSCPKCLARNRDLTVCLIVIGLQLIAIIAIILMVWSSQ